MDNKFEIKSSLRIKILLGVTTLILIVLMFPSGQSIESEINEGMIWVEEDLIAPFSFEVRKEKEIYEAEVNEAVNKVLDVYTKEMGFEDRLIDSLKHFNLHFSEVIDSVLNGSQNIPLPIYISSATLKTFIDLRKIEKEGKGSLFSQGLAFLEQIILLPYKPGIISYTPVDNDSILVKLDEKTVIGQPADMYNQITSAREIIFEKIRFKNYPADLETALSEYITPFIQANIVFRPDLKKEFEDKAKASVSRSIGIVNENERIIGKHERVTKDVKQKIDSYKAEKAEQFGEEGMILQLVGKILHISALIVLFGIYLNLFRKKIFNNNQKLLLIAINIVFFSFLTFLSNNFYVDAPLQMLIFIPTASMLLTVIFDSRVGFYATVIISLVAGAIRGNDYAFSIMNIVAGAFAVYTVRDIKNRNQIFRSFLYILAGYFVTIIAFGLEKFASFLDMVMELGYASVNALISPVLTYGLLIFFEKFFKITTDLTLVELSNFDHPLLKELARRAPGTFNHSMTMGTLVEAAAENIGANPLLARVGAYYHDIGKTIMPQNFVENQLNNRNIHEELTPEESVDLLKRHIAEGIALAKEHNLPPEIIDFIPMHHGTTVMTYFYDKAKKIYGEANLDIADFRYDGPKPNTKEAALIMFADSCESAVRSIDNPDSQKIENLINNIIQSRINDGQLDESTITFIDINKIKETFVNILLGQHHRRIRYPKQDELEKKTD